MWYVQHRAESPCSLAAFSFAGIMVSDYLEKEYPARNNRAVPSSAPDEPRLEGARGEEAEAKPRLFSISVVDRS